MRWSPGTCWARSRPAAARCATSTAAAERVQASVAGWVDERYALACNGYAVPLTRTETRGRIRRRHPLQGLGPASARCTRRIQAQTPLVFDVYDRWTGRSLGGLTHHVVASRRAQLRDLPGQRQRGRGAAPRPVPALRPYAGADAAPRPLPAGIARTLDLRRARLTHRERMRAAWTGRLTSPRGADRGISRRRHDGLRPARRDGRRRRRLPPALARAARRPLRARPGRAGGARQAARPRLRARKASPACCPAASDAPAWRCDPVPLILPPGEFAALEAGLAQRAAPAGGGAGGPLRPAAPAGRGRCCRRRWSIANPAFLRSCRDSAGHRQAPLLHLYAADLLRGAGRRAGACWRTAPPAPTGLAPCAGEPPRAVALRAGAVPGARRSAGIGPSSTSGRTRCSGWRRRPRMAATRASRC